MFAFYLCYMDYVVNLWDALFTLANVPITKKYLGCAVYISKCSYLQVIIVLSTLVHRNTN